MTAPVTDTRAAAPPIRITVGEEVTLSVHLAGPETGTPVLLLHGWPELARSWTHQIPALAACGYRVIAPDQRGFGASDAPDAVEAYRIDRLVGDLTGLLDALGLAEAVWVGHDWGGLVAWHGALLARDRVAGVIGVNTPYSPPPARAPIEVLRDVFGPDHYIVRFQEEGAEAAFTGREDAFFAFMFQRVRRDRARETDGRPPAGAYDLLGAFARFEGAPEDGIVVPAATRAAYAQAYRRAGFRGGLNWYRNFDANWRLVRGLDPTLAQPCLMIAARDDLYLPAELIERMPPLIADLTTHVISDCGHWTQWEAPQELNRVMTAWLTERFPTPPPKARPAGEPAA